MKTRSRHVVFSSVAILCCLYFFIPFVTHDSNLAAQSPARESEVCLDCHEDMRDRLMGTPHLMATTDTEDAVVACSDCHAGDERHWEEDAEEYPRMNPSKLSATAAMQVCSGCHVQSHQQNMQERNAHAQNEINCSGCHEIHVAENAATPHGGYQYAVTQFTGLLKKNEVDLCLDCHIDVRGQFAKPYRHPVNDGIVKCSECHMTLDVASGRNSFAGTNAACYECHNEFKGPFPFEHQATVDYSTEEGACLNCHEPHGSHLPRMLNQTFESPHFALCSRCHLVPKHNLNQQHGTMWAGLPCTDCHVDIHGSYVSKRFFSPALQAQGCINAGCHQF
ncbi:MAG: hypothetical protein OEN01_06160 [Candidatus Krumholzibacteria bacterium]|nr:hypothetical protein [Candidatus Krumholzibacteria bacterium]